LWARCPVVFCGGIWLARNKLIFDNRSMPNWNMVFSLIFHRLVWFLVGFLELYWFVRRCSILCFIRFTLNSYILGREFINYIWSLNWWQNFIKNSIRHNNILINKAPHTVFFSGNFYVFYKLNYLFLLWNVHSDLANLFYGQDE
jgi:hypothetical protein